MATMSHRKDQDCSLVLLRAGTWGRTVSAILSLLLLAPCAFGEERKPPWRVLMLFDEASGLRALEIIERSFEETLLEAATRRVEFYHEHLDAPLPRLRASRAFRGLLEGEVRPRGARCGRPDHWREAGLGLAHPPRVVPECADRLRGVPVQRSKADSVSTRDDGSAGSHRCRSSPEGRAGRQAADTAGGRRLRASYDAPRTAQPRGGCRQELSRGNVRVLDRADSSADPGFRGGAARRLPGVLPGAFPRFSGGFVLPMAVRPVAGQGGQCPSVRHL